MPISVALLSLALSPPIAFPPAEPLTTAELKIACAVAPVALKALSGFGGAAMLEGEAAAAFRSPTEPMWKELPRYLYCDAGRIRLRQGRNQYGDFVDSIAISRDGARAVVSGGYVYTSMMGNGGECHFVREGRVWKLEACVGTWAV